MGSDPQNSYPAQPALYEAVDFFKGCENLSRPDKRTTGIYAACLIRIEYNKYYKNTVKVSASAEASWLVSHAAGSSASGKRKRESVSSSNVVAS